MMSEVVDKTSLGYRFDSFVDTVNIGAINSSQQHSEHIASMGTC